MTQQGETSGIKFPDLRLSSLLSYPLKAEVKGAVLSPIHRLASEKEIHVGKMRHQLEGWNDREIQGNTVVIKIYTLKSDLVNVDMFPLHAVKNRIKQLYIQYDSHFLFLKQSWRKQTHMFMGST